MTLSALPELVTLGETQVSMVPASVGPLRYNTSFYQKIAGAESNLAIGLAKLGHSASWISRLGTDEFGQFVLNGIRAEGVGTTGVVFDPEHRTGVMFKEMTGGESSVYYYRENSAASHLHPDDLDHELFQAARIVHLTGITPALSQSCHDAVLKAMELAREFGKLISFDANIRLKLWGTREFVPILREMTLGADIVLIGLDEANTLFGTEKVEEIFDILLSGAGSARAVAVKNGAGGAWVADADMRRHVKPFPVKAIEPIGAGDAFNAGFLSGYLEGRDIESCGRMGNICGAMATTVVGDIEGYLSRERLMAILSGGHVVYR